MTKLGHWLHWAYWRHSNFGHIETQDKDFQICPHWVYWGHLDFEYIVTLGTLGILGTFKFWPHWDFGQIGDFGDIQIWAHLDKFKCIQCPCACRKSLQYPLSLYCWQLPIVLISTLYIFEFGYIQHSTCLYCAQYPNIPI